MTNNILPQIETYGEHHKPGSYRIEVEGPYGPRGHSTSVRTFNGARTGYYEAHCTCFWSGPTYWVTPEGISRGAGFSKLPIEIGLYIAGGTTKELLDILDAEALEHVTSLA